MATQSKIKIHMADVHKAFGEKVVLQGIDLDIYEGESVVIEAGSELKILARNRLEEKCKASMAASQGNLFIRSERNLFCIGERPSE